MDQLKTISAVLLAFLVLGSAHAQNLRETLFSEADSVLAAAQEKKAYVLSPEAYKDGYKLYKKAERELEDGENLAGIRRDLSKAVEYLEKAIENTKLAQVTFTSVMKAREDADQANARKYASELWNEAEAELVDAAEELEGGDVNDAKRGGAEAEGLYRKAELAAIKGNYLSETKEILQRAEDMDVSDYAPKTLEKAKRLLASAEEAITKNRYDIDRPRDLARKAKYEARHAIYLAKRIEAVDDHEQTMEELILDYESAISSIAGTANIVAELDQGYEEPTEKIVSYIEELQDRARQQTFDIEEMKEQLGALSSERAGLKRREALQKQADRVDRMFSRDEANVLRKGDDIILRLIGLNFASGKAEIESKNFRLLSKVQNAIEGFSGPKLVVEGHTDSFGSDASNRTLSQKRAESVRRYLIENTELTEDSISAVGYGETVPVANNETPEGRQKNRRIDIVIKPNA